MTYAEECDAALDEDIEALRYILHDLHKGSPQFWEEEETVWKTKNLMCLKQKEKN